MLRRNKTNLPEQLEALEAVLPLAHDRLPEPHLDDARQVAAKAKGRLRHGTTHTLVALLGATGSGKSSVANALVGSDVATTGVRRPTTSSTLACFWGDDDPQPLLDWLEVSNRHHVAGEPHDESADGEALNGLVLLDVPDHDSVAVSHRLEMERIAAHADLLLWVTDAEKYGDKAMHDYLRELSTHGAVTAMILNKTDLLSQAELTSCVDDLERLLAQDGLPRSPVVPISATTGQGVLQLRSLVSDAVSRRAAMVDRLRADTVKSATQLLGDLGPDTGSDRVSNKVADRLASELVGASGVQIVTDAVAAGHRRDASSKVGWPFTRWARALRPHPLRKLHLGRGSGGRSSLPEISGVQLARSENAVRQALADVSAELPDPWPEIVAAAGTPNQASLNSQLDSAVSESVRQIHRDRKPMWWQLANGLQITLAVAVVVGAVWLALLAFGAYLRLPDVPTPEYRGIPYPTGLLIGGIVVGLLLALIFRQLAAVGAKRRANAVRKNAEIAVRRVSDELIVAPVQLELETRDQLRQLLLRAGAESP